jgi:hypothetical protein
MNIQGEEHRLYKIVTTWNTLSNITHYIFKILRIIFNL